MGRVRGRGPRAARILIGAALILSGVLLTTAPAHSACDAREQFEHRVQGLQHCLAMKRYGAAHPRTLVVWLHGDLPGSGYADHHLAAARETAARFSDRRVMSVALVRPGYPLSAHEASEGNPLGRSDHYTRENIDELAAAIERLRARFNPVSVVGVGYAGGAANAALLLGRHPTVLDAAVLVACPCDLIVWRMGRRFWGRSDNPIRWASGVRREARVIALTGEHDRVTPPELAQSYVDVLRQREVEAHFRLLPGQTHDASLGASAVLSAIGELIEP